MNHEAVAEGLSQALASVSDNIIDCCRSLEIFDTTAMKQKIGDLYSLVFLLLSDVMDWFMKKRRNRFLDSFNENLYKKFEDRIKSINETSATIRNLAAQSSYAEGRATRLYLEELGQDLRAGLEGQARQRAEMEYHASTIARQIEQSRMERLELRKEAGVQFTHLVAELQKLVYGRALAYIQHERPILLASDLPVLNSLTVDSAYGISNTPSMEWIAEDIAINSVHLEDYFHRDRVRLPYDSLGPVPALQQDLFQRLIDWTTETNESSKVLWLDGPPTDADDLENSLTMLASYFVNIAASSGVPTLSCLCELRRGERLRPSNTTLEVQALLCLAYSLVRQMIEILPPKFETYIDLSVTRFAKLDGTESSWADVISVLRDLVALMPDKLCCVIDGLHWIDTAMSERLLRDLLKELRNDKFKLLITTTGRSATLRNEVYAFETVHIDKLDRTQN